MPLSQGTRLGVYEVLGVLGAGGMGEVYRARDTRLDRTVAIKVLPAAQADNPELRQRQEREARAVSSLGHPHICALFDIGRQDGIDYLVMEYLEGETLAARLVKGPLEARQVLHYAIQIAGALDHAHRKGVLHRDLKPGNVMITKSGAKLLDFGLAKIEEVLPPASGVTATVSLPLTEKGTVLGTFQYMSPEQLEGRQTDARSDIFTFGAVLYEMATGKRAFDSASRLGVMSAILERVPAPILSLQPAVSPMLDHAVQRCLAKDPEQRWQTARDLELELQWIADGGSQFGAQVAVPARQRHPQHKWIAIAVALTIFFATMAALAASKGWFRSKPADSAASRFLIPLPENTRMPSGVAAPQMAISADGRKLVFAAAGPGGKPFLWIRPLGSFNPQRLDRTDGGEFPFWSPDGQSIGFFADHKLKKVAASGGAPQTICDAPPGGGGTWSRDGTIVFAGTAGLMWVPSSGGLPSPVTILDQSRSETSHMWPQFLPDGKHFLYLARSTDSEKSGIYVQEIGSAQKALVLKSIFRALYAPPGDLLFVREGTLFAQHLDLRRFQLTGEADAVAPDINFTERTGRTGFTVSDNGVLVYRSSMGVTGKRLTWYDRDGKRLASIGGPADFDQIALSPDEKHVAVARPERIGASSLWLIDLANDSSRRLTLDPQEWLAFPIWSNDSQRIAYRNVKNGGLEEIALSSGAKTVLVASHADPQDWSSDGRLLAFVDADTKKLSLLDFLSERKPLAIIDTSFEFSDARFSPDGRQIAYTSRQSGRPEVYIASMPSLAEKRQISNGGGSRPMWRKDGKELFFISEDRKLMVAGMQTGNALNAPIVKPLFPLLVSASGAQYAVAGDGQKFLVNEIPQTDAEHLNIVLNWTADISR